MTKQINKVLKCGLLLNITTYNSSIIRIELAAPSDSLTEISGYMKDHEGNYTSNSKKLVVFINSDNLPILRDVLNEVDPPKPKWYEFWKQQ